LISYRSWEKPWRIRVIVNLGSYLKDELGKSETLPGLAVGAVNLFIDAEVVIEHFFPLDPVREA